MLIAVVLFLLVILGPLGDTSPNSVSKGDLWWRCQQSMFTTCEGVDSRILLAGARVFGGGGAIQSGTGGRERGPAQPQRSVWIRPSRGFGR